MLGTLESKLYALQRITAVIMAPLIVIHLVAIILATKGGLSAAEILSRTQGFGIWTVFYGVFVIAAAIHAPLGLRKILGEWTRLSPRAIDGLMIILLFILLGLGLRAVWAVTV